MWHIFGSVSISRPAGLRAGFHAEPDAGHAIGLLHAGEQWAPGTFAIGRHCHAGWELYLQAHGATSWRAASEVRHLLPGDLLIVAPRIEHSLAARPATNHHFFYAAFDLEAVLARHPAVRSPWTTPQGFWHVTGGERLQPAFQTLVRELAIRLPYPGEGLSVALDVLVIEATRVLAAPRAAPVLLTHPAVAATRDLLDAHYDRRWRLTELAARVGLSAKHLHELFSRHIGVTPHRYQLERRMRRARDLLTVTSLPVTTIAFELGFSSSQQFSRTFRQQHGHTPTAHRVQARPQRSATRMSSPGANRTL